MQIGISALSSALTLARYRFAFEDVAFDAETYEGKLAKVRFFIRATVFQPFGVHLVRRRAFCKKSQ